MSGSYNSNCAAEKCIDSEAAANPSANCNKAATSTCHSPGQVANPWLQVDLGGSYRVGGVGILNRLGCCQDRLAHFEILVSDLPSAMAGAGINATLCTSATAPASSGDRMLHYPCNASLHGRYVTAAC